jgi:putative transposase
MHAADWPWSSARAHLAGRDDGVVTTAPVLGMVGDFAAYLGAPEDTAAVTAIRRSRTTGRPVGEAAWLEALEARTSRQLAPQKRVPKSGTKQGDREGCREADARGDDFPRR